MSVKICLVIPVRLDSSRFPRKVLAKYNGKSLLANSLTIANNIKNKLNVDIFVATDSINKEILDTIEEFGATPFLMSNVVYPNISCGSERLKYVYNYIPTYDYYMTLPVDEPEIDAEEVVRAFGKMDDNSVYTLWSRFFSEGDLVSNYSCKMVVEQDSVIYTSRAVIPATKSGGHELSIYKKHVGVFIFPNKILSKHSNIWEPTLSATLESLEQNMFIGKKFSFKAIEIKHDGFGVDSPEQINQLEKRFNIGK